MTTEAKVQAAKFSDDDVLYALENAAEFLDNEEWPHDDGTEDEGKQVAANRKAANLIRGIVKRIESRIVCRLQKGTR